MRLCQGAAAHGRVIDLCASLAVSMQSFLSRVARIQSRRTEYSCATRSHKKPARRFHVFSDHSHRKVSSSFFRRASSLEITAEGQVQIHPFAKSRGLDLGELNFCGKVFPRETQDGEHIDLALSVL